MKAIDENYGVGWYDRERDDKGPFRWMTKQATVSFGRHEIQGKHYLRIIAGHSFPDEDPPRLSVYLNGHKLGEEEIEAAYSPYFFPFSGNGHLEFEFKLDRVFHVYGDPRDMGIMIREIEVSAPDEIGVFLDGWYLPETTDAEEDESQPRWMKKKAHCLFINLPENREKYLIVEAGHSFEGEENPTLTVISNGDVIGTKEIIPAYRIYYFPLSTSSQSFEIELQLNKQFPPEVTRDTRNLGALVKNLEVILPERTEFLYEQGWYAWEFDEFFPYSWMTQNANVFLGSSEVMEHKYISFFAFSEYANFKQMLRLELDRNVIGEIPLIKNWNYYSFALPPDERLNPDKSGYELWFSLDRIFPENFHSDDPRELGIKISTLTFHNDPKAHEDFLFFHKNIVLNYEERQQGQVELKSFPLNLGIDLFAKCNMKPPCVYCLWDWTKEWEEGHIEDVVDAKTFEDYGSFFRSSRLLINCSIGEPLMHPQFEQILDYCAKHNKIMEISTNGQTFTKRTIKALVGKPIYLYISLDAATKETYAKIRNDRWESIIPNLELLNQERKKNGNLPKIHMVFIPMKVNRNDLEEYFRLCQRIDADALILRPLLVLNDPKIEHDRGGYHFDYIKELLPREELEEIFKECEEYSKKYGVNVANQFSFGISDRDKLKNKEAVDLETQRF
ncbi:radical SAM protein [Acidobacteriota bacterium]